MSVDVSCILCRYFATEFLRAQRTQQHRQTPGEPAASGEFIVGFSGWHSLWMLMDLIDLLMDLLIYIDLIDVIDLIDLIAF